MGSFRVFLEEADKDYIITVGERYVWPYHEPDEEDALDEPGQSPRQYKRFFFTTLPEALAAFQKNIEQVYKHEIAKLNKQVRAYTPEISHISLTRMVHDTNKLNIKKNSDLAWWNRPQTGLGKVHFGPSATSEIKSLEMPQLPKQEKPKSWLQKILQR
jgi:hypothetical protein